MRLFALLLVVLCLTGCAAGTNPSVGTPDAQGDVAGFWLGLWHGLIIVITWICSLFSDSVQIYEVHNNGGWYNFGFMLGMGALTSGGSKVASKS